MINLKKLTTMLMAAVLLVSAAPAAVLYAASTALPTSSKVLINGKNTAFDAYNIDGSNYFKLRDLAFSLNGTAKQFDVGWDAAKNAISLTNSKPYTVAGGEMASKGAGNKSATPTKSKIYLDGREVSFTAYNIDGNNYFKLRDIGQAFNFGVEWDAASNTVAIDTNKRYDTNTATANTSTPTPKPTAAANPKSASKLSSSDFIVSIGGTKIKPGDNVKNVIDALGSGYEYSEVISCDHDGMDKTYTYGNVEFYTYPDGKIDRIDEIILTSSTYQTARGIAVSDSIEKVNTAYGEEYTDSSQYFVSYKDTGGVLCFYKSGNTVTSISIARK